MWLRNWVLGKPRSPGEAQGQFRGETCSLPLHQTAHLLSIYLSLTFTCSNFLKAPRVAPDTWTKPADKLDSGETSVGGRRRLGCSEGLNKPERLEGAARRRWLNTWEGSGFPCGTRGQEFGFHSGWVVWEMVEEFKSR